MDTKINACNAIDTILDMANDAEKLRNELREKHGNTNIGYCFYSGYFNAMKDAIIVLQQCIADVQHQEKTQ